MSNIDIAPVLKAGFTIKGLKTWNTHDGGGYQFTLLHHGKKVAQVTNDGNGGDTVIEWTGVRWDGSIWTPPDLTGAKKAAWARDARLAQAAKAELDAIVKAAPPDTSWGDPLEVDAGWFMEELVNVEAMLRQIKRGKTLFKVPGRSDNEYLVLNAPYDSRVKAYLDRKYPGAVVLNETLAGMTA